MAESPKQVVNEDTRDLNDVFDSIACLESSTLDEGYIQGLKEGRQESSANGFVIGINTSSSISIELGYAQAFCATILQLPQDNSPNIVTWCTEVIEKVKSFPTKNVAHDDNDVSTKVAEIKSQLQRIKTAIKKHSSSESNTVTTAATQKFDI